MIIPYPYWTCDVWGYSTVAVISIISFNILLLLLCLLLFCHSFCESLKGPSDMVGFFLSNKLYVLTCLFFFIVFIHGSLFNLNNPDILLLVNRGISLSIYILFFWVHFAWFCTVVFVNVVAIFSFLFKYLKIFILFYVNCLFNFFSSIKLLQLINVQIN